MAPAVQGFFGNGGGRAYIARILGKGATCASVRLAPDDAEGAISFEARTPGAWGNRLGVRIMRGTRAGIRVSIYEMRLDRSEGGELGQPLEDFDNLALDTQGPNFALQVINENSRWVSCSTMNLRYASSPKTILAVLVGGTDGAPLDAADYCGEPSSLPEQGTGLSGLANLDDVALLCVPDHVHPGMRAEDREKIAKETVAQCERLQDRFALLSVEGGQSDLAAIRPIVDTAFAALYHPWICVEEPTLKRDIWIPSMGDVAGIFARCDLVQGVHRSPADQEVRGLSREGERGSVEFSLTADDLDTLERLGVNAICDLGKARGVRVTSALTMSIDAQQRSIGARRFVSFVQDSILRGTRWAEFEINDERLWASIADQIQTFLKSLWESGALLGSEPAEAFFVRCDRSTMTQVDIDNGRVIILIGLSLAEPGAVVTRAITIQTTRPGMK